MELEIIKYLILGIVQGFTEPLPISSSGHMVIFETIFNMDLEGVAFEALINFGSTLAIIMFFRKRIAWLFWGGVKYLKSGLKENTAESKYLWNIFFSTLPLVAITIVGIILGIELPTTIQVVGYALIVTGVLLLIVSKSNGKIPVAKMTISMALFVGIFQAFAILPGLSRSGLTLTALLLIGIKKKDAFNYSFLMYIPASIGALFYSVYELISMGVLQVNFIITATLSMVLAFVFTWIGLIVTKKVLIAAKLHYFALYCFVVSLLIIIFA